MKTRILPALMALVLSLTVLSGCTGETAPVEPKKAPVQEEVLAPAPAPEPQPEPEPEPEPSPERDYVLNTRSYKFHYPECSSVRQMKEENTEYYTGSREDVIRRGYDPCGRCNP